MPTATKMGEFEGKTVSKTTISVRNAGDGLSQAMKVDPQLLHQGDQVFVVLECEVGPVSFDPIKDSESECERKHVLRAGNAAIVSGDLVREAIEQQTARIIAAREEEKGIQQLSPEAARMVEHDQGLHKRKRKNCPACYPDEVVEPGATPIGAARSRRTRRASTRSSGGDES